MTTTAGRTAEARKRVCPNCHAEAGKPCKRRPSFNRAANAGIPGKLMAGIHAERLALVPASKETS